MKGISREPALIGIWRKGHICRVADSLGTWALGRKVIVIVFCRSVLEHQRKTKVYIKYNKISILRQIITYTFSTSVPWRTSIVTKEKHC